MFLLDKVLLDDESEDGLVGDLRLGVVIVVEVDAGEAVVSFWPKPKRRASQEEEEPLAEEVEDEDGDDDTGVGVVDEAVAAVTVVDR